MLYWVADILCFLRYSIECFKGDPNPGTQLLCGGVQCSINCFVCQILPISDIVIKFVDPLEIAESLLDKYHCLKLLTKLKKLPVLPLPVPAAVKTIENENTMSSLPWCWTKTPSCSSLPSSPSWSYSPHLFAASVAAEDDQWLQFQLEEACPSSSSWTSSICGSWPTAPAPSPGPLWSVGLQSSSRTRGITN